VVFHMTDLPFGRGGSPLQNLIIRGFKNTKISAIRVSDGMDTGNIYLKRPVSLKGSAEQIYARLSQIVFSDMIPHIIKNEPTPTPQTGKITLFKRRLPEESNLEPVKTISDAYDFIRMLDAPEYPKAFLQTKGLRFEFSKARLRKNKLAAQVEVYEK